MTTENPIRAAVAPLKADAQKRAAAWAQEYVDQMVKDMEVAGWNLKKAAPYPGSSSMSRTEFGRLEGRHNTYKSLTEAKPRSPDWYHRQRSYPAELLFIEDAVTNAAIQYDLFIIKLMEKVGTCYGAQLEGNHVWGHSILTVWKHEQPSERWKTQSIVNVSKLGKVFNQWPTRKVK